MNLQVVRAGRSIFDMSVYTNGMVTIGSAFAKKFQLENKNILVSLDQDDKDNRFIYLTVDPMGKDPNGFTCKKSKGGSIQIYVMRLAGITKEGRVRYNYHGQVNQGAKGYIQLERVADVAEPETNSKKKNVSSEKKN